MESIPPLKPVAPVRPPADYLGGKRNLARQIIARLSEIPHTTYAEPFVGMGGVFLRRPFRAACEVINDINQDVANLFRILQRHYVPFLDTIKWQLTSRAEFERLSAANPDTLTDLERAARFLYLQRTAFGGKVTGQNFGVSVGLGGRFDLTKLVPTLEAVHERLAGVVVERLPYADLVRRYDRPATLFYLDPPYWGSEADYGAGVFTPDDFHRLAELLAGIKGRFLLSINDRQEVRAIFRGFAIEAVKTTYTIQDGGSQPAAELFISGPRRVRKR